VLAGGLSGVEGGDRLILSASLAVQDGLRLFSGGKQIVSLLQGGGVVTDEVVDASTRGFETLASVLIALE